MSFYLSFKHREEDFDKIKVAKVRRKKRQNNVYDITHFSKASRSCEQRYCLNKALN